ncbi:hypothetical protein C8R47DRAFT_1165968 [Mycena vitilis]|nr:hypothetical protein C8R47DRAFT_1165968 [Mycena vitilis]
MLIKVQLPVCHGIKALFSRSPPPPMWSSAILSNPTARVYNFRVLIVVCMAWSAMEDGAVPLAIGGVIFVHHISVLFTCRLRLAMFDMVLTVFEIMVVIYAGIWWSYWMNAILVPLILAAIFRTVSIRASSSRFWGQRFVFLGGCQTGNPPYTPWRMLLNRSLARPFVRGEFVGKGRRPLSALGVAHLLQRRTLNRQWHEDFPSLQTEGGQPGSASAGIVAFIRNVW